MPFGPLCISSSQSSSWGPRLQVDMFLHNRICSASMCSARGSVSSQPSSPLHPWGRQFVTSGCVVSQKFLVRESNKMERCRGSQIEPTKHESSFIYLRSLREENSWTWVGPNSPSTSFEGCCPWGTWTKSDKDGYNMVEPSIKVGLETLPLGSRG